MARRVIEALVDDVDGSPGDETVSFGFEGRTYEIDLSHANAAKLRAVVAPWVDRARKTGRAGARPRVARPQAGQDNGQLAVIRAWAAQNGHRVSSRGRISAEVTAAYRAAQSAPPESAPAPTSRKPDIPAFVEPTKKSGKKATKKTAVARA